MSYSPKKKIKNEYRTNSISNISESRFHDLRRFFFLNIWKSYIGFSYDKH